MQRYLFPRSTERHKQLDLQSGMRIGMDILIVRNTLSREDYVLILVDHASKYKSRHGPRELKELARVKVVPG